jgi:succinyl-CoA synthetase alpha subunit
MPTKKPAPGRAKPSAATAAAAGRRIQVRRSGVHGRGVFALQDIAEGEPIIEYVGEIITWKEALRRHPEVSVFINFASMRSVFATTMKVLELAGGKDRVHTVAIIAEGVPEQHTRLIIRAAEARGVSLIGPATVGGGFTCLSSH